MLERNRSRVGQVPHSRVELAKVLDGVGAEEKRPFVRPGRHADEGDLGVRNDPTRHIGAGAGDLLKGGQLNPAQRFV